MSIKDNVLSLLEYYNDMISCAQQSRKQVKDLATTLGIDTSDVYDTKEDDEEDIDKYQHVIAVSHENEDKKTLFLRKGPIKTNGFRKWWTDKLSEAKTYNSYDEADNSIEDYDEAEEIIPTGYSVPFPHRIMPGKPLKNLKKNLKKKANTVWSK